MDGSRNAAVHAGEFAEQPYDKRRPETSRLQRRQIPQTPGRCHSPLCQESFREAF